LALGLSGKLGLGVTEQRLLIDGNTVRTAPGGAAPPCPGGILATAANRGRFQESHFALVPELGVSVGWWLTPQLRASVGYNLIYWTDVIRPGLQIDRHVNPALVPADRTYNPNAPVTRTSPLWQRSDFSAEGLTVGF